MYYKRTMQRLFVGILWSKMCTQLTAFLSIDATVHGESRMRLERLLSGAGLSARAALHSVSLSAPHPAVAGLIHGKWYTAYYLACKIKAFLSVLALPT